jgi:hypothetical protein
MEETYTTIGAVAIGVGAVAAGVVGLLLPRGEQLTAVLALVVGAGIGVVTLALGFQITGNESSEDGARTFMVASLLGLAGVAASLAAIVARSRQRARDTASTPHPPPTSVR